LDKSKVRREMRTIQIILKAARPDFYGGTSDIRYATY